MGPKLILTELNFLSSIPTTLFQDNMSTIRLILHKKKAGRTKHNMIRECVKCNNIKIEYLPTDQMIEDTLTKPLGAVLFQTHQERLLNLHPPKV